MLEKDLWVEEERQITTVRVIDASIDRVFEAWSNPVTLKQWWGPKGFTNTFETFEFVPGGRWKFVMHGPEKGNYQNEVIFLKIERPHLISWDRVTNPLFRVVTTFETEGDGTRLTFRMQFATKEECEKLRKFVADKNEENFDKLETLLLDPTPDLN